MTDDQMSGPFKDWPAPDFDEWKAGRGLPDCICPHRWEHLGKLYGISMGNSWVRLSKDPDCPHHGHDPVVYIQRESSEDS